MRPGWETASVVPLASVAFIEQFIHIFLEFVLVIEPASSSPDVICQAVDRNVTSEKTVCLSIKVRLVRIGSRIDQGKHQELMPLNFFEQLGFLAFWEILL